MHNMFSGRELFEMKATYGLPLDFALEMIRDAGLVVEWVGFIEAARDNGWWDYQTYDVMKTVLPQAGYTEDEQYNILQRFKLYVLANLHPKMKD